MKKYLPIAISSVCSALLAVFFFTIFQKPKTVFIDRNDGSAVYANYGEFDPFYNNSQRTFLSASPTDFTAAADISIASPMSS